MSRTREVKLELRGYDETKIDLLDRAWREAWGPEGELSTEYDDEEEILSDYRIGVLCGGVSEEEFADMLSAALWEANGDVCHICLTMTLGDLPCADFEFGGPAYRTWAKAVKQVTVSAGNPA